MFKRPSNTLLKYLECEDQIEIHIEKKTRLKAKSHYYNQTRTISSLRPITSAFVAKNDERQSQQRFQPEVLLEGVLRHRGAAPNSQRAQQSQLCSPGARWCCHHLRHSGIQKRPRV